MVTLPKELRGLSAGHPEQMMSNGGIGPINKTTTMTTLIEKDSAIPGALLITAVSVLLVLGVALGIADMGGTFRERNAVFKTNRTVENRTVIMPAEAPPIMVLASAPEPKKATPKATP
jgi:hypothetical protein